MKKLFSLLMLIGTFNAFGQYEFNRISNISHTDLKIVSRSYGPIIGLQKGKFTFVELGAEYHWRKIRLKNPKIYSLGGNFEYNFGHNLLGYKLNFWTKQNRVDLTYGATVMYLTDFDYARIGITPTFGFRLIGFHILTGYNFTLGDKQLEYNDLFIALRYFIPSENKIKFKKK